MKYKEIVAQILSIDWRLLRSEGDLGKLMYISWITAQEFAASLRIAEKLYPKDEKLKSLIASELQTNNLQFLGYKKTGDHYEFLQYFLIESGFMRKVVGTTGEVLQVNGWLIPLELRKAAQEYLETIEKMPDDLRAMTIFSREHELPKLFTNILTNQHFGTSHLSWHLRAYEYYLKTHIQLDSEEGGHDDLTKHFELDDRLTIFYEARYKLYKSLDSSF